MIALSHLLIAMVGQTMSYPPLDVPALVVCRFPDKAGSALAAKGLALYFPLGIGKDATDKKIVDPHMLLEARDLNSSLRTERSWTLQEKSDGSTSQSAVKLTLTSTSEVGGFMASIRGKAEAWIGACAGNTGQTVEAAFLRIAEDPKLLDIAK